MYIFSFGVHFPDERCCRLHFKAQRDKEGVICHRCKASDHYWLENKWSYQCTNPVKQEYPCVAARLWRVRNYLL